MLYIILAALLIITLLLLAELYMFSTIDVRLKGQILKISVKTPLYRKKFKIDLGKKEAEEKPKPKKRAEEKKSEKSALSVKMDEIKKRVFSPDTGFDTDELKKVLDEFKETYSYGVGIIKKLLGKLRHKIHIKKLFVRIEYGTDNPATTGIVYGSAWNLVGIVYPILTMYFHIVYPTLDLTPDFYNKRFDIEVRSIIKVRAAHIIGAGFSSLFVPMFTYFKDKLRKGRGRNGR